MSDLDTMREKSTEELARVARVGRAGGNLSTAVKSERWMAATWHVDENGQVQMTLQMNAWKDGDMGTAHAMLRDQLSKTLREKAARAATNDGTQKMGLDPAAGK